MARSPNWSYASYDEDESISVIGNYIWDSNILAWIKQTPAASGGGGPVTIADGDDVAQGSRADATWVSGSGTVISLLKAIAGASGGGGLTDAQLRATPVPVSGPLTDLQLRASAVAISGTVSISGTVPVSGPLTDTQLRATPVPVSGTVTATGPLTDAQLRATPVAVSGTVNVGTVPVTGPLTDVQLRATPVPISGSVTTTAPADVVATGDLAVTNDTVQVALVGTQSVAVNVLGTWSGSVYFECSIDNGTTWGIVSAIVAGAGNNVGASTGSNGLYQFEAIGGASHARVRAVSWVSGTANIHLRATTGEAAVGRTRVTEMPTVGVRGADAHDGPISTNPVHTGGTASSTQPSPVSTDGDVVRLWLDRSGATQATLRTSAGAEIAPLTDTQLRASPLTVTGSFTASADPNAASVSAQNDQRRLQEVALIQDNLGNLYTRSLGERYSSKRYDFEVR